MQKMVVITLRYVIVVQPMTGTDCRLLWTIGMYVYFARVNPHIEPSRSVERLLPSCHSQPPARGPAGFDSSVPERLRLSAYLTRQRQGEQWLPRLTTT